MATPKGSIPHNKGKGKGWIDPRGYRQTRVNGKTVREHRVLIEKHLGRKLDAWEHVHHKDGDKLNNSIENLEVIDGANHAIEHHKGSKRTDQAKITMSTIKTMHEEIKRLREVNSEMLEALERALPFLKTYNDDSWWNVADLVEKALAKARGENK